MEVEYTVTLDDYTRFNQYYCAHSALVRRRRLRTMLLTPGALIIVAFVLHQSAGSVSPFLVFGPLAIVWFVAFPRYWDWEVRRRARSLYFEGHSAESVEACALRVDEYGLHVSSQKGGGTLKWSAVEKLVETDTHLFVLLGPTNALMIPRRAFSDSAAFERFVAHMRQLRETAAGHPAIQ